MMGMHHLSPRTSNQVLGVAFSSPAVVSFAAPPSDSLVKGPWSYGDRKRVRVVALAEAPQQGGGKTHPVADMPSAVRPLTSWVLPCVLLSLIRPGEPVGVYASFWRNCGYGGKPLVERIDNFAFNPGWIPQELNDSFSARWMGTISIPTSQNLTFTCDTNGTTSFILWIDNQLMCPTRNPFTGAEEGLLYLPLFGGRKYAFRADMITMVQHPGQSPEVAVRYKDYMHEGGMWEPLPSDWLRPEISRARQKREELRARIEQGWGTWVNKDMATHALLPHGLGLSLGFHNSATDKYIGQLKVGHRDDEVQVQAGPHSYYHMGDKGKRAAVYTELSVQVDNLEVRIQSYSPEGGQDLMLVVTPEQVLSQSFELVLTPAFLFSRVGSIDTKEPLGHHHGLLQAGGHLLLRADAPGLPAIHLWQGPTGQACTLHQPGPVNNTASSHFASRSQQLPEGSLVCPLSYAAAAASSSTRESLVFSTQPIQSVAEILQAVDRARVAEVTGYKLRSSGGEHSSDLFEAMHTVLGWLTMYDPFEGVTTPVSKGWDFGWGYVLFDWDSYFASLMMAWDPEGKDMAYSTAIQITQTATTNPDGSKFVPNYASGRVKSFDRTEPQIGAKVVNELYTRYGDTWLVELLYEDLVQWNNWTWGTRRLPPTGLIALGSTPHPWAVHSDDSINTMQGARYESGLDNWPPYDVACFDNVTSNLMQMYDVGFSGMFAADCAELAALAAVLGRDDDVVLLTQRGRAMAQLIQQHLWDEEHGIFDNRYGDGDFVGRWGPPNFYPMLTGVPSPEQVEIMLRRHLSNVSEFCLTPDCPYYGLPSISRSDPAFPGGTYWRGRMWGPMVQLIYWALRHSEYQDVRGITEARKALAELSASALLAEWRAYRHIHENYDATTGHGDNVPNSDPFYHWGGLCALVWLMEEEQHTNG